MLFTQVDRFRYGNLDDAPENLDTTLVDGTLAYRKFFLNDWNGAFRTSRGDDCGRFGNLISSVILVDKFCTVVAKNPFHGRDLL